LEGHPILALEAALSEDAFEIRLAGLPLGLNEGGYVDAATQGSHKVFQPTTSRRSQ
jgi:hypothetical protein